MNLVKLYLQEAYKGAENILISGAGGGFDVLAGIPILYELLELGKKVVLANYSFTELTKSTSRMPRPSCYEISSSDEENSGLHYFPEKHLKTFLNGEGLDIPLYGFERTGVKPLTAAYDYIIDEHNIDSIILIDGGTDSLMRGDEEGLGTPIEDVTSIAAVQLARCDKTNLFALGYGVDRFHGVSDYLFLENSASLQKQNFFKGCLSLLPQTHGFKLYQKAVDHCNIAMPYRPSIVNNSIVSAVSGEYGDFHRTDRTKGSELWINPLMGLYWMYQLEGVVKEMVYFDAIKESETAIDVNHSIYVARQDQKLRKGRSIPG